MPGIKWRTFVLLCCNRKNVLLAIIPCSKISSSKLFIYVNYIVTKMKSIHFICITQLRCFTGRQFVINIDLMHSSSSIYCTFYIVLKTMFCLFNLNPRYPRVLHARKTSGKIYFQSILGCQTITFCN